MAMGMRREDRDRVVQRRRRAGAAVAVVAGAVALGVILSGGAGPEDGRGSLGGVPSAATPSRAVAGSPAAPGGSSPGAVSALRLDPATLGRLAERARAEVAEHRARQAGVAAPHATGGATAGGAGAPSLRATAATAQRAPDPVSGARLRILEAGGVLRRVQDGIEISGVTHTKVQLHKDGLPVLNRVARLHERDGESLGRTGQLSIPPADPASWAAAQLDASSALARARELTGAELLRGQPRVEQGWFALTGATVPAYRVTLPAASPRATWQVTLDARSGDALGLVDLVRLANGSGSVYAKNVVLTPTPSLEPLFDLDGSGYLAGVYTRVLDLRSAAALRPDSVYNFAAGSPGFVQTSVYRALTDTGRFATSNGFPAFGSPILAYTNLPDASNPSGELNNAFYDPGIPPAGQGAPPIVPPSFGFGNGDGVLTANLGTDLDVAAHEMGHHLFEILVAPLILSSRDPVLAMTEGVADTLSALLGGDPDIAESSLPGQPFLRTLANSLEFADVASATDPHEIGLVYGGANWDLITGFGPLPGLGANLFGQYLFEALPFLPPNPFEFEYRDAFLQADTAFHGGANAALIGNVFAARGFDDVSPPPGFVAFLEDGIGEAGSLADSPPLPTDPNAAVYIFFEFPNSEDVTFTASGPGNVELLVAPLNFDPQNPVTVTSFDGVAGTTETVTITRSSAPVNVDLDEAWFVVVSDAPDGAASSFTVTATGTLPAASIVIDGPTVNGALSQQGEVDYFTFDGAAGQVVRLEGAGGQPQVDPLIAIVNPRTFQVYGVDDDSGPGNDALIQGVQLPFTGTFAALVLSPVADVDPAAGTGPYTLTLSTCANTGTDTDGDGLVDVCDDDDDNDGFIDADDLAPTNPLSCADLDLDTCDDCSGGSPNIATDGPDFDADTVCDAGDLDDDNDGCIDAVDPQPFFVSPDDDLDGFGADCDNCVANANPDQLDTDSDGRGDVCDNCRFEPNPAQDDRGGKGTGTPDGIGDACQCGDVNGDGRITVADAVEITRSRLVPPTVTLTPAETRRCDVGSTAACTVADAVIVRRALLVPPTQSITQSCPAATGAP